MTQEAASAAAAAPFAAAAAALPVFLASPAKCFTIRFTLQASALGCTAREAFYEGAFGRPNYEERREAKPLAKEAMSGYFKITRGKPSALNAFDKNVLEVDCGLGMRLRAFQDYGWWVMGTESR